MIHYESIHTHSEWQELWSTMPQPHILQSWEWGEIKQETNHWQPLRFAFRQNRRIVAIAYLGLRRWGPVRVLYAPRGPLLAKGFVDYPPLLDCLENIAKQSGALWLKIDPGIVTAQRLVCESDWQEDPAGEVFASALRNAAWRQSPQQIQFPNTQILSLTCELDELLANISSNTRRKIRLAERRGVMVRAGDERDLDLLYSLYAETAKRDGFPIRKETYYHRVWRQLMQADMAQPFIAEYKREPLAHCILLHGGQTCWYFYGASTNRERGRMPNYALQWAAIRWAKRRGYQQYDFWGAPTVFEEHDPLWNVYRFKRGFRGTLIKQIGAWDYAPSTRRYAWFQRLETLRRKRR